MDTQYGIHNLDNLGNMFSLTFLLENASHLICCDWFVLTDTKDTVTVLLSDPVLEFVHLKVLPLTLVLALLQRLFVPKRTIELDQQVVVGKIRVEVTTTDLILRYVEHLEALEHCVVPLLQRGEVGTWLDHPTDADKLHLPYFDGMQIFEEGKWFIVRCHVL